MKSMWRLYIVGFLCFVAWPALAAEKIVYVPRVKAARLADGTFDGKSWQKAVRLELNDFWNQTGPGQKTEVLLFNTGQELAFLFRVEDDDIQAKGVVHDTWVHKDDCVELFFGAPWDHLVDALGFEINALGTCADYYYRHDGWFNRKWNPEGVTIVLRRSDAVPLIDSKRKGYTVEVVIPWKVLNEGLMLPETPDKLRANFARWNYFGTGRKFLVWNNSQLPQPGAHYPDHFGWLIFMP